MVGLLLFDSCRIFGSKMQIDMRDTLAEFVYSNFHSNSFLIPRSGKLVMFLASKLQVYSLWKLASMVLTVHLLFHLPESALFSLEGWSHYSGRHASSECYVLLTSASSSRMRCLLALVPGRKLMHDIHTVDPNSAELTLRSGYDGGWGSCFECSWGSWLTWTHTIAGEAVPCFGQKHA